MNRRGFISALCATLVAPDPDKLLWQPGARLISIPAPLVKKYKVQYEYATGRGYESALYFCESQALPMHEARELARQKMHFYTTKGTSFFQARLYEYTGLPESEHIGYAKRVPWKAIKG